ncbi:MAG: hypothetical protein JWR32_3412 [Mycobacterium sp.]|jgi:hypothetical protein|nr:hypothetical protein [Mycobacterium sp.]
MADDELDELYRVKPEGFTELRTKLAEATKRRGDAAAAKRISSARKPTTAAWAVNRLALGDKRAKPRLTDLGERLRAAHAAMDGDLIRELTREQRALIHELAGGAFEAAELTDPSAALRDDVTDTLQAAIADPDVASRLGRLTKAERWSGFGSFGDAAPASSVARAGKVKAQPHQAPRQETDDKPRENDLERARQRRVRASAAVTAAERAKAHADETVSERQAELAQAQLRCDEARSALGEAQRGLTAAQDAHEKARQASRDAAELVKEAKAQLKQSR